MGNQQKLTALLHELQNARSPLAQARILARAWRTVRELSPTDRRLLARHAGFDGAEEILEGLGRRKGGLAPAMLLRVLANARGTDGSTVSELLAAIRDPQRGDEAISLGAELASNLLAEPETEQEPEEPATEIVETNEEFQAVEESIIETPEEALTALNALEPERVEDIEPTLVPDPETEVARDLEPVPESETESEPPPSPPPPIVDWGRWHEAPPRRRPAPTPQEMTRPSFSDAGRTSLEARAVIGAMAAEQSVFSQLRVLRRELSGFSGSSTHTLIELIEAFPDGWARRRALCALLETGIPAETRDALELVACLGRQFDRRWCLGILARLGNLRDGSLSQALDLVDSEFSKRRLTAIAG